MPDFTEYLKSCEPVGDARMPDTKSTPGQIQFNLSSIDIWDMGVTARKRLRSIQGRLKWASRKRKRQARKRLARKRAKQ